MPSKKRSGEIAADFLEKEHSSEWAGDRLFAAAARAAESGGLSWLGTAEEAVSWVASGLRGAKLSAGGEGSSEALAAKMLLALEAAAGDEWDGASCCDALAAALRDGKMGCSGEWIKRMRDPREELAAKSFRTGKSGKPKR